jgi:hypothetical protein
MQGRCPVREQFVHVWSTVAGGCSEVRFAQRVDLRPLSSKALSANPRETIALTPSGDKVRAEEAWACESGVMATIVPDSSEDAFREVLAWLAAQGR